MATVLNFEAAQCQRDPRFMARVRLAQTAATLSELAAGDASAMEISAAMEAVEWAFAELEATG
jgi:hypothetical protein